MELGLEGKRVFITASVNGIGLQIARTFLLEGASVIINGRNAERLEDVKKQLKLETKAETVDIFPGDISRQEEISSCKKYVKEKWGALDILIPNLGTGKAFSNNRMDVSEWKYMMEYNLLSTVQLINCFEDLLVKGNNANIVLISSVVSFERAETPYAYAASKGAIRTLNRYLAADYAKKKIRINCVVPGNVLFEGGRWEELLNTDREGVEQYIRNNVPMNRFAKPEEIANMVVFLASERSSFTTGAEVVIDGGQKRSI